LPLPRKVCTCSQAPDVASFGHDSLGLRICQLTLTFDVSRDEETVRLKMQGGGRTTDLGERGHNYLLLTLARRRLADAAAQHAQGSCGWMYPDELARGLQMSRMQLNTEVCRIRKRFAAAGLLDPEGIIERRHAAGQLRIGSPTVSIVMG
jgi:hypothetical protein